VVKNGSFGIFNPQSGEKRFIEVIHWLKDTTMMVTLIVTDANGCTASRSIELRVGLSRNFNDLNQLQRYGMVLSDTLFCDFLISPRGMYVDKVNWPP